MSDIFDVIVVGAGVSGLGIARTIRDAGYNVSLLEKERVGQATSNNSLRIIHGGFRYLQNLNVIRTLQSARDQSALLKEYPKLVRSLPCIMPLDTFGLKSRYPAKVALLLYSAISKSQGSQLPIGRILKNEFISKEIPILAGLTNEHYLLWHDALLIDPPFLSESLMTNLGEMNVKVIELADVTSISRKNDLLHVAFVQGGVERVQIARVVVNSTGPWLDHIKLHDVKKRSVENVWAKAFNIIINFQLDPKYGIAIKSQEGRLYFAVPRGDKTVIGTGELPHFGNPKEVTIPESETVKFINEFSEALNGPKITEQHIESLEIGVLPASTAVGRDVSLIGNHQIFMNQGYCEALSTKYTTYASLGRGVSKVVTQYLKEVGY